MRSSVLPEFHANMASMFSSNLVLGYLSSRALSLESEIDVHQRKRFKIRHDSHFYLEQNNEKENAEHSKNPKTLLDLRHQTNRHKRANKILRLENLKTSH